MLSRVGTPHLLVSATFLAGTGLVMVHSASALRAEISFGSSSVYFWRQTMGLALGLLAGRGPLSGGCGRACDGCRKPCARRTAL